MRELGQYFNATPDETGGTVSLPEQLYRYRVTEALMYAGIEIAKSDHIHPLLQRAGHSLTNSEHLKPFIPKVEASELDRLLTEQIEQFIATIFDSTPRQGDLMCCVNRWCSDDFLLVQRLICLLTSVGHLNAA